MRTATWIALCALMLVVPAIAQDAEPTRRILGTVHLRVLHWPEHESLATIARDAGESAVVRLEAMLAMELEDRIDVFIVRSQGEFDELTGVKNNPWIIGRAMPRLLRVVVKPRGPQRLPELVVHEIAHIMLDLRMGEHAHHLPRWLHEGVAKYAARDFDDNDRRVIAEAALSEDLLTIDELEDAFRGDRGEVALAYAQSYTLVAYLSDIRPAEGLSPLLDQLSRGRDVRLALGLAYHRPVPQMEQEWLEQVRTGYVHHIAPPYSEAIMGALFLIAFVISWIAVRRRSARIRERMRREEELRQSSEAMEPGLYVIRPTTDSDGDDADDDDLPVIE